MKVKELLADPSNWTKGYYARDANGRRVSSVAPDACCWCIWGAIYKCYSIASLEYLDALRKVMGKLNVNTGAELSQWNDNIDRTHAQVLQLATELDI